MATSERLYTWEEVAQHNSVSTGVWVVVEGRIYDVTQFVDEVSSLYLPHIRFLASFFSSLHSTLAEKRCCWTTPVSPG